MTLFRPLALLGALALTATPISSFAAGNHYGWCIGVGNKHDGECGTTQSPSVYPPTVSGTVPVSTQTNPGYAIPPMPQATPMLQPYLAPQAVPHATPAAMPQLVPQIMPQPKPGYLAPQATPHPTPGATPYLVPQIVQQPRPGFATPQATPHPTPVATPYLVPQLVSRPKPGYAAPLATPHPTPVATPQRVPQIVQQPRPGYAVPQAVPHPTPVATPSLVPMIARPKPVDTPQPDAVRRIVTTLPPGTTPDRGLVTHAPGRQPLHAPAVFSSTKGDHGWNCVASGHGRRRRVDANGTATETGSLPGLVFSETIARDIPAWHSQDSGCLIAVRRKARR